ncbi:MAG: YlxR family protein [Desulfatiglandales bacterium]
MGREKEHNPIRTCIICGARRPKSDLLRFVLNHQKKVILDERRRLSGRGAYICRNNTCLSQLTRKNRFNRAFRTNAFLSDDLAQTVEGV